MSERDELALMAYEAMFPGASTEDLTLPPSLLLVADAFLAAGYRKQDVTVIAEDEPTHEGWDSHHFVKTGCDGSLHASGDCLEKWS